jgi:hypothetical protein
MKNESYIDFFIEEEIVTILVQSFNAALANAGNSLRNDL